jgi:hypothetical protein
MNPGIDVRATDPAQCGSVRQCKTFAQTTLVAILALVALGSHRVMAQQYSSPIYAPSYGYSQPAAPSNSYNPQYYPPRQPAYQQPEAYPQQPQGYPQQPNGYPQQNYGSSDPTEENGQPAYAPAQPMNPDQLEQLVAPIALYPDSLLAQILAASTYPAQISAADQWLRSLGNASPDQVALGANAQTGWDPSIKALTAFPQVLSMLNQNLQWTTALGNAYYNQPQDVLQTVQVMRQRAEQAGNLQTTPQENVTENQGYISLAPPDPQVVYVPTYNPWQVYGQPVAPYPGFSLLGALGSFFGASPIQYGLSFAMSAFMHTPFGLLSWGLDWLANSILFNHSNYFTHSNSVADWGFRHGGPRAFGGGAAYGRLRGGPSRSWNSVNSVGREQSFNRGSAYRGVRPESSFTNQGGLNRSFAGYGSARSGQQQAYNHAPEAIGRSLQYAGRPQSFAPRQQAYANPGAHYGTGSYQRPSAPMQQSYRAPESNFGHGTYGGAYGGRPFAYSGGSYGKSERSSGSFHAFGGSHGSESFGGSHAPKSFSSGGGHSFKSSGGGHSGGGHSSHSGGHKH